MLSYNYSYEIIVIDDASTDNSILEIKRFKSAYPKTNICLIQNEKPMGVSYNFSNAAVIGTGKYFRMLGGHFQDRKEAIKNAFDRLGQADIIITYMHPDCRKFFRRVLSKTYTYLVNLISGYAIAHYHGTPIHLRIDVLRWHSYRYVGFYADLTTRLLDEGVTYIEVPTPAYERELGKSLALKPYNFVSLIVGFSDILNRRFSKNRASSTRIELKMDGRSTKS
jgi:glycosyltransferase involved in cell wall biosynthesis